MRQRQFLYIALQTLKDIELRVILEAESLGLERPAFMQVGPECVLGIEINEYAAELARVSVWIGEIQWMLKHGFGANKNPILKPLNQIECRDALIDESGAEASWPSVDVIIGNPPFLGGNKKRRELGEAMFDTLNRVYGTEVPGAADLVCYWFAKARMHIERGNSRRAGLVATQSIRNGASRKVLDTIVAELAVTNAWSDEPWVNEGAAVRVSIICFSPPSESQSAPVKNGVTVEKINADFSHRFSVDLPTVVEWGQSSADITKAVALSENRRVCFQGSQKIGAFDIAGDLARQWLLLPNPHEKPNRDVLKPSWNGLDVTRRSRDGWIIDFGTLMTEAEAALYEAPFQYVVKNVMVSRLANRRPIRAKYWWRHGDAQPAMRAAIAQMERLLLRQKPPNIESLFGRTARCFRIKS